MNKPNHWTLTETGGFSLVEMVIVVLIVGVVAGWGMPSYTKSVEASKADEAVSLLRTIAGARRSYDLNHRSDPGWEQVAEGFPSSTPQGQCGTFPQCASWQLTACGYMPDQNWSSLAYEYHACDPTTGDGGCGCDMAANIIASACRKTDGSSQATNVSPYIDWRYAVDINGNVLASPGAPPPPIQ